MFLKDYFEERKKHKKLNEDLLPHLGVEEEVFNIIKKSISDFILRITLNSSFVVLGLYDIVSENFYKYDVDSYFDNLPKNLSFALDFSPYIKNFTSDEFKYDINSKEHKIIIDAFFNYYFIRLPVLFKHCRFIDWPNEMGFSDENLKEIAIYTVYSLQTYFPEIAYKINSAANDSEDNIFYKFSQGKVKALLHNSEDEELKNFIYDEYPIWSAIRESLSKINYNIKNNRNSFYFFRSEFNNRFNMFWESYKNDYLDTLQNWYYVGAFKGNKNDLLNISNNKKYWIELEESLNSRDYQLTKRQILNNED